MMGRSELPVLGFPLINSCRRSWHRSSANSLRLCCGLEQGIKGRPFFPAFGPAYPCVLKNLHYFPT